MANNKQSNLSFLLQSLANTLQTASQQSDHEVLADGPNSAIHQICSKLLFRWTAFGTVLLPNSTNELFCLGANETLDYWIQQQQEGIEAVVRKHFASLHLPESGAVAELYGRLLGYRIVRAEGAFSVELTARKKQTGSYYTPPALARLVVERTLEGFDLRSAESILALRICDFACGGGAFLVEVCRYLSEKLVQLDQSSDNAGLEARLHSAKQRIAENCIYGMDIDPLAVQIARYELAQFCDADFVPELGEHIQVGDALQKHDKSKQFDAVVGNPPFVNAIESGSGVGWKQRLRDHPLRGTADYAFYFVSQAHRVTKREGAVGLVVPLSFLNAPAARSLREELVRSRPPSFVGLPGDNDLFSQANTKVAALVLGGKQHLTRPIDHENWWACLQEPISRLGINAPHFLKKSSVQVSASMTTQLAYDLIPHLQDLRDTDWPKLVTAGLIDPHECCWGKVRCRYLKRDYQYPVIHDGKLPSALQRRLDLARRPKILVAGVAGKHGGLEAFVDPHGQYAGAVSTFSIWHEQDSLRELTALCKLLHTNEVKEFVHSRLAAAAMGNGLLTIRKSFLQELIAGE